MCKKAFTVVRYLVSIIIGLFVIFYIWNLTYRKIERRNVDGAYGKTISINGKKMTINIAENDSDSVIILLPGWGCASPVLEFKPLAEQLSKKYRVITVEPLGYGLSDGTSKERTVENIVRELHECVKQFDCQQYYLMGHSIAGLYSLYWANEYPNEVQGFIGIDPSVPKMEDEEPLPIKMTTINRLSAYWGKVMNVTGISRLKSIGNSRNAIYADTDYAYTKKEIEIFRILSIDETYNQTVMDELNQMENNLQVVRNMKVPITVPVLEFISEDNCKMVPTWEQLHRDTIAHEGIGEIIKMRGGHYLHFEHADELVQKVNDWIPKN